MQLKWIGFSAIMIGMSASALMQTLVATCLPTIVQQMGGTAMYSWVFGAYMLASTITIPLFAGLADRWGRRRLYVSGLCVFLIGSLLVGTSATFGQLLAYRVIQGIGAGAVAPAALASIGELFGEQQRGKLFGIIGAVQVMANLVGPPLGGWITDAFSWRWGFFAMVPLGAAALVPAMIGLPGAAGQASIRDLRMDWVGALAIGSGLCAALLGLQGLGAGHPLMGILLCAAAALALGLAVQWEKKHPNPVVPTDLLRRPILVQSVLGTLLLGAVTSSAVAYLPLYLQKVHGFTASTIGLALLPILLAAGVASGLGGALASRCPRPAMIVAWMLVALGFLLMAWLSLAKIALVSAMIGAGLGLLLPIYLLSAQQSGGPTHLAATSGLIQMARNMGGALGIPLLGIWLAGGQANRPVFTGIFACLVAAGLLGLVLAIAFGRPQPPA